MGINLRLEGVSARRRVGAVMSSLVAFVVLMSGELGTGVSMAQTGGSSLPVGGQVFEDVPPGSTFYDFVNNIYGDDIAAGYPCGGPQEPCGPENRPYYRPGAGVTRGQMSKFVDLSRKEPGIDINTADHERPIQASTSMTDGIGLVGVHAATEGTAPGVEGVTNSTANFANGVVGHVAPTDSGDGSAGVRGINSGTSGFGVGVYGSHAGSGWGVYGTSASGGLGVYGLSNGSGSGVLGRSSGAGVGVYGTNDSPSGYAGRFDGNVLASGPMTVTTDLTIGDDLAVAGDIQKTYVGFGGPASHPAVPVAYGYVIANGVPGNGSSNFISVYDEDNDYYVIAIAGENYINGGYITVVTPSVVGGAPKLVATGSIDGSLVVTLYTTAGVKTTGDFQFIVYKP